MDHKSRGHSLLEVTIAVGLMGLVMLVGSMMFHRASIASAMATNNEFRTQIVKQVTEILQPALSAPGVNTFDPALTVYDNPGHPIQYAGTWLTHSVNDGTAKTIDSTLIYPFAVGTSQFHQDSHLVVAYRIVTDAAGNVSRQALHALVSRCIDSRQPTTPTTLAEILALRRPFVTGGSLACCNDAASCGGDGEATQPYYWPTIFVYKTDGTVFTLPTLVERAVVPGVGFEVYFNHQTDPDHARFAAFMLENRCKTSNVGFGSRAVLDCSRTIVGKPIDANFKTDISLTNVIELSRPLNSDITGSGFIRL